MKKQKFYNAIWKAKDTMQELFEEYPGYSAGHFCLDLIREMETNIEKIAMIAVLSKASYMTSSPSENFVTQIFLPPTHKCMEWKTIKNAIEVFNKRKPMSITVFSTENDPVKGFYWPEREIRLEVI
jgi:hypothetical protein